jgi:hypothetical protein
MQMGGEQRIKAPRTKVWAAINDPDVLKQCIPGCLSLDKISDERMKAVAAVKIGPIGARFSGEVKLSDIDPPNRCRIQGEGQGGAAGFASGGATVSLEEDGPEATILRYEVTAQVGGRLAQLGGGLVDVTAKQLAGAFFKRFDEVVAPQSAASDEHAPTAREAEVRAPTPKTSPARAIVSGLPFWSMMLALLAAACAGFLFGRAAAGWDGSGLVVVLTAAAAFNFGRQAGASPSPIIIPDAATLARLAEAVARAKAD